MSEKEWKADLYDLLGSNFRNEDYARAVSIVAWQDSLTIEDHKKHLNALTEAIRAASAGDNEVFNIVSEGGWFYEVDDLETAKQKLQSLLAEYSEEYEEACKRNSLSD